jgi:predicted DNA-binding protein (MmcQ/YjbR family)
LRRNFLSRNLRTEREYCQPERIEDLKAQYECIGNPFNESSKHWIGIDPNSAPDDLLQELTRNSYEIVKEKYTKK